MSDMFQRLITLTKVAHWHAEHRTEPTKVDLEQLKNLALCVAVLQLGSEEFAAIMPEIALMPERLEKLTDDELMQSVDAAFDPPKDAK